MDAHTKRTSRLYTKFVQKTHWQTDKLSIVNYFWSPKDWNVPVVKRKHSGELSIDMMSNKILIDNYVRRYPHLINGCIKGETVVINDSSDP